MPLNTLQLTFWASIIGRRRQALPQPGEPERSMTQETLAKLAGMNNAEIVSLWEKGARFPKLDHVPQIAEALQYDPKTLTQWAVWVYHPKVWKALYPHLERPGENQERKKMTYTQREILLIENFRQLQPDEQSSVMFFVQSLASSRSGLPEMKRIAQTLQAR